MAMVNGKIIYINRSFMKRLLYLIGLLFAIYSFPALADDSTTKALSNLFTPSQNDQSLIYLNYIFGQVGNVLTSQLSDSGSAIAANVSILGSLFSVFNKIVLAVGTFVVLFSTVAGVLNTSNEGEALGRKWSSVWLPLRTVIGVSCLIPGGSGYSILQVGLMWVIVHGVGAADELWSTALKFMDSYGFVTSQDFSSSNGINSALKAQGVVDAAYKGVLCNQFFSEFSDVYFSTITGVEFSNLHDLTETSVPKPIIAKESILDTNTGQKTITINYGSFTTEFKSDPGTNCLGGANGNACVKMYENAVQKACGNIKLTEGTSANNKIYVQGVLNAIDAINQNYMSVLKPVVGIINSQEGDFFRGVSGTSYDSDKLQNTLTTFINSAASTITAQGQVYMNALASIAMQIQVTDTDLEGNYQDMAKAGWLFAGSFFHRMARLDGGLNSRDITQSDPIPTAGQCPSNHALLSDICQDSVNTPILKVMSNYCQNKELASTTTDPSTLQYCTVAQAADAKNSFFYSKYTDDNNATEWKSSGPMFLIDNFARWIVLLFIDMVTGSSAGLGGWEATDTQGFTEFFGKNGPLSLNEAKDDKNEYRNPIIAVQILGNHIIQVLKWWIVSFVVALFLVGWAAGSMLPVAAGIATAAKWFYILFVPIIFAIFGAVFMAGLSMAYYVPLIPFLTFLFTSLGWFIAVVESMLAAPIIALGYLSPEGDEFWGRSSPAIMIMLNIFLRPSFMIFGLLAGLILSMVGVSLLNAMYAGVVRELVEGWAVGVSAMISLIVTYVGLILTIMNKSFSMIYTVPNRILRWIGGHEEQTGEAEDIAAVKGIYDSGADGIGEAGALAGRAGRTFGQASASRAQRKGEEKKAQEGKAVQLSSGGNQAGSDSGKGSVNASEKKSDMSVQGQSGQGQNGQEQQGTNADKK